MFNVRVETPSGAQSRGYDRETEEKALAVFERVISQLKVWPKFVADVILFDGRDEATRERIHVD